MSKTVARLQHEKKLLQSTLDGFNQRIVKAQHQEDLDAAEKKVATLKLQKLCARLPDQALLVDILETFAYRAWGGGEKKPPNDLVLHLTTAIEKF